MASPASDTKRVRYVAAGTVAAFFVTAALQIKVQAFDAASILKKASDSRRYIVRRPDPARRGTVYASDGVVLAQSEDSYVLNIEYSRVPLSPGFFMALSEASGIPESEMSQPAFAKLRNRTWNRPLSNEQANRVRTVKTEWNADGVSLDRAKRRDYPLAEAAAGLIGRVDPNQRSIGMELKLDNLLAGTDGESFGFVDRTGVFVPKTVNQKSTPKVNGTDVTLTIDSRLQLAATQALRSAVEKHKAEQGVAIIYDPKTGDILAAANWPTYDPENPKKGQHELDPVYMARLEPGSLFKVLTLAKALDAGVVTDNSVINCAGVYKVNKRSSVKCDSHHGNRAHGQTNNEQAIAKSCNVSAAIWALKVGPDSMEQFLRDLGLLENVTEDPKKPETLRLGVPYYLPGSYVRDKWAWKHQLATLGFGQSMTANPIALASAFGLIGNEGVRMKPRLIRSIGGRMVPTESAGQIITKENSDKLLGYMESVMSKEYGTGYKLRIPGYRLAGKTGTAQKTNLKTKRVSGAGYVSNYVGFVPAVNPRVEILVMIDYPKGDYYGATVAGPVFQDLAKTMIRYYNIPPDSAVTSEPVAKLPKTAKPNKKPAKKPTTRVPR